MSASTYYSLNQKLVDAFPELQSAYQSQLDWWAPETPGPHVMYGDVLNPFIVSSIERLDDSVLRRVATYLEQIATSGDDKSIDVVVVTVLSYLSSQPDWIGPFREYLGQHTRKLLQEYETWRPRRST
jgi:hypothetical protein